MRMGGDPCVTQRLSKRSFGMPTANPVDIVTISAAYRSAVINRIGGLRGYMAKTRQRG